MPATNAKMDFEAFGVQGIELPRLKPRAAHVKDVLRFERVSSAFSADAAA
jgi:hypothetical protein